MLHRVPGGFEEQPLLRVDGGGVGRRDAEEQRVEAVYRAEEPAVLGVGLGIGRPAVRWHRTDGGASLFQEAPEGIEVVGAGKPSGHADDGDRLIALPRHGRA